MSEVLTDIWGEGMRLHPKLVALIAASLILNTEATVRAQVAEDQLQRLVETSAERLAIAKQIALAKWDSGVPVEDEVREAQGLNSFEISQCFKAQIETNKLVQYSLLADWRRIDKAPDHQPVILTSVRPKLDRLELELIDELTRAAAIRASRPCGSYIARAVGKYVPAHRIQVGSLNAVALIDLPPLPSQHESALTSLFFGSQMLPTSLPPKIDGLN